MRGMWKHLERLGGGVGTRGPGESQLETDRRLARTASRCCARRLRELRKQRATMRRQRERNEVPSVALAGYTNVGKSTLLNALTGSEVSSADRLFETLDPTTRSYDYLGRTYLLTDTVGFVRKLPHQLVAAFASTLEETLLADLILHVADASADEEERERQIAVRRARARRDRRRRDAAPARAQQGRPLQRGGARAACATATRTPCSSRRARARGSSTSSGAIGEHFAGRFERVALLVPFDQGGVLARAVRARLADRARGHGRGRAHPRPSPARAGRALRLVPARPDRCVRPSVLELPVAPPAPRRARRRARAYEGDAGFDLVSVEAAELAPGARARRSAAASRSSCPRAPAASCCRARGSRAITA